MLKSNLWDNNDAYILVRSNITIIRYNVTQVAFKNSALFITFMTKIDVITIDDAEDLDLTRPMDNLLEYSSYYTRTTGSLWIFSKDKATNFNADIVNGNTFKSFKCKAKLLGNTVADGANGILRNTAIAVSLKYLINLGRSLEMPLIICKVELKLKWTNHYVLSAAVADNDDANSNIIFSIKDTKLYVPVVIFSTEDNQKLSKVLNKGFER